MIIRLGSKTTQRADRPLAVCGYRTRSLLCVSPCPPEYFAPIQAQEPACCPTGIATVRFKIEDGKLKALDPIPNP